MPNKDATLNAGDTLTTPADEAPVLDQVLALLKDVTARQERLEAEVRATKAATPAFRPMAPPAGHKGASGIFAGMTPKPGQAVERDGVSKQILVDARGDKLAGMILAQYPPRFQAGDPCRIDPDAARPGWPEGKTWGQVLEAAQSPGVGVVRKVYWLKDSGEWKYSAQIRGITNQRPDGFLDRELLPA